MDYGDLRLVVLSMIAQTPRHGYDLMAGIAEASGGAYEPSPGAIYPVLHWLEDMGYAVAEAEGGRKSYATTAEGQAFLTANQGAMDGLMERLKSAEPRRGRREGPIGEAMGALKTALKSRGPIEDAEAEKIAAALAEVTRLVQGQ